MRRGASAAGFLILLAGCGREEPPPSTPPAPPVVEQPEPPLPLVAELSFPAWEDVDPETPPELPAGEPAPLRWSFPEGRRFGYDFDQTTRQLTTASQGGRSGTATGRDRNGGTFEVVARGGGTAGVLVSIESREAFRDDQAVSVEELKKKGPSRFEVELREDGTASYKKLESGADARLFFDLLLAAREGNRTLESGVVLTTRIAGRRKVGRHECVRLETEAAGPISGGRGVMRGRALGYFDPAEGRFVRASAVVAASQRQNVKDPKGSWVTHAVDSRTSFRVRLLER